jgi:hypothetical protein
MNISMKRIALSCPSCNSDRITFTFTIDFAPPRFKVHHGKMAHNQSAALAAAAAAAAAAAIAALDKDFQVFGDSRRTASELRTDEPPPEQQQPQREVRKGKAGKARTSTITPTEDLMSSVAQWEIDRQGKLNQQPDSQQPDNMIIFPAKPQLSSVDVQVTDRAVRKLTAFMVARGYNALGLKNLDKRDANGRVVARAWVLGFPVNKSDPMLNQEGSALAKSMVPFTLMRALVPEEDVVLDIHPEAAQWEACHKRLLDPKLIGEMAQLIVAVPWSSEILAFGRLANEALRSALGSVSVVGDLYGLGAPRYAFTAPKSGTTVCCFVHPQNLLTTWSGEDDATEFCRIFDAFASRLCVREGLPAPRLSLVKWIASEVESLSPLQRRFAHLGQLRSVEKRTGVLKPFDELPEYAKIALVAMGKGNTYWARPATEWEGYASPVFAILSTNGVIGGKASSKKQGLSILEDGGMTREDLARVSDEEARQAWGRDKGKASSKKQGLSILEAGGMPKKELSRVTDKEAREAWGRKWAGVAGSAPPKDAALKSANRNEFYWSAEAAAIFQDAVTELGGPASAMPSAIIQILSLGPLHHLTFPQVTSRLQKVRKQPRAATSQLQTHAVAPAAPAPKKPKRKRAYSTGNLSDDDFDCPR